MFDPLPKLQTKHNNLVACKTRTEVPNQSLDIGHPPELAGVGRSWGRVSPVTLVLLFIGPIENLHCKLMQVQPGLMDMPHFSVSDKTSRHAQEAIDAIRPLFPGKTCQIPPGVPRLVHDRTVQGRGWKGPPTVR